MSRRKLIILGSAVIVTVFSLLTYFTFNYLGITSSRLRRREITLVSEGAEKQYDGTPISNDNWYLESGTLVEGDTLIVTMEASLTLPGTIPNEPGVTILNSDNENVTSNYKINLRSGDLTIRALSIWVSTPSETKTYDGLPLSNDDYTIHSLELFEGHHVDYVMNSSITEPGTIDNQMTVNVYDASNHNVNDIYNIVIDVGTLTVLERMISVRTTSASKIYDGTPLTCDGYLLVQNELLTNHRIEYVMNSSITNPGTQTNSISLTIYDESDKIVTDLYQIEYDLGELTIISREFTVSTESAEKVYDGEALTNSNYIIPANAVLDTHRIEYTMNSSITTPGTTQNKITITIYDENDRRVNNLYDISYDLGSLTIFAIDILVTTESDTKVYDTLPLTNSGYEVVGNTLLEGHNIDIEMISSITNPGSVDNDVVVNIYDNANNLVNNLYNIEKNLGTLLVEGRSIIIETASDSKVYDDTPLENHDVNVVFIDLLDGHRIDYVMNASITNAGSLPNSVDVLIYDDQNEIVNQFYDIQAELGTLTITQRDILIETSSAEKLYDGEALTDQNMVIVHEDLLPTHRIDYEMSSSITLPGSANNRIGVTVYDDSDRIVTDNYNIQVDYGSLTIIARQVVIDTNSDSKLYDETPLINQGYVITLNELLPNHTVDISLNSSLTLPGSIDNEAVVNVYDEFNNLLTGIYDIRVNEGTLSVMKREVVIQTESASKIYDGSALTNPNYVPLVVDILSNHSVSYSEMNSSITNPGTIDNEITAYIYDENSQDISHLYSIRYELGTLQINKVPIVISTESVTKDYDGSPITSTIWDYASGGLMNGHTASVTMNSSITLPGSIDNEIGFVVYDTNNHLVTDLYDLDYQLGTLTVRAIEIVISSASDSKVYDGTPLTNPAYTHHSGDLLTGHTLNVVVDGSITDVGTVPNHVYAYIVEDGTNASMNHYYTFTYYTGELEILTGVYSGNEISNESFPTSTAPVFRVYSDTTGYIYMRDMSWGDYNLQGFNAPVVQTLSISTNPFNFSSEALIEESYVNSTVQVEYIRSQVSFLVPYHNTAIYTSMDDVHINGDTSITTTFNYIDYDFDYLDNYQIQDPILAAEELSYRTFVYNNYLDLPQTTRTEIEAIAQTNGIVSTSPTIITDVRDYIRSAATYNLDFPDIPENEDRVIYFLTVTQEGICQHFASAATVMYRAMGIPARYVTGYLAGAQADTWATVTADYGHAWVEIYIDGFGWIPVEATGSSNIPDPTLPDIYVTPDKVEDIYSPGKTIVATTATVTGFDEFAAQGYTYEVTFAGIQSEPGIGVSTVSTFIIRDSLGTIVTDEFNIIPEEGVLQMYGYAIDLETQTAVKVYDGIALTNEVYAITGSLGTGHYEVVTFGNSRLDAGFERNTATILIYDSEGTDVTYLYQISYTVGVLMVTPRTITVTAGSATKQYDGVALTSDEFTTGVGDLVATDTIEVTTDGEQINVGEGINVIDTVLITRDGVSIIGNYTISTVEGSLVVTP